MNAAAALRAAHRYLMNTYRRPQLVFTRGRGCYVYDHRGRRYLDFLGGIAVNALGHAHPAVVRALRRQAARAIHVSNLYHNEFQGPLAEQLAACSGMDRVFFTNSGSEAVETALKLARAYAKQKTNGASRVRLLALDGAFHGRTFGALTVTAAAKYRDPFAPLLPEVTFVRLNDVADLEAKFDARVCALILEPIQGEGGIQPVSEAFYSRARQLCTAHDAALIVDEIQCGLGRTGRWFAYQKFPERPDLVTVAKPLAAGLPLGAVLARENFAAAFTPGLHGSTFGGGPLACAVALAVLRTIQRERLLENVRARGAELLAGLHELARRFRCIREIRGEGLMLGIELETDAAPYVERALARGLLVNATHERVLRLLPPYILTAAQVRTFLDRLADVLARTPRAKPSRPTPSPAVARAVSRAARAAAH